MGSYINKKGLSSPLRNWFAANNTDSSMDRTRLPKTEVGGSSPSRVQLKYLTM